ncbi:hypothetical protein BdWA1_000378 [Babesia duncani]|uniref:Uncharacterized protein n=1 Tax=Babesia duncani TaxID=323732 RepID=A0AAD9UPY9_9APIC|nr:hypothetical protein BdWA1_000378 [Babesia duncani]
MENLRLLMQKERNSRAAQTATARAVTTITKPPVNLGDPELDQTESPKVNVSNAPESQAPGVHGTTDSESVQPLEQPEQVEDVEYVLLSDDDQDPNEPRPNGAIVSYDLDETQGQETKTSPQGTNAETAQNLDPSSILIYHALDSVICSGTSYDPKEHFEANTHPFIGIDTANDNESATISRAPSKRIKLAPNTRLPQGFFDDANLDAQASGMWDQEQAKEHLKRLKETRGPFLQEIAHIHKKETESLQEEARLKRDERDHQRTITRLKNVLDEFKANVKRTSEIEPSAYTDLTESLEKPLEPLEPLESLELPDDAWKCRSLV